MVTETKKSDFWKISAIILIILQIIEITFVFLGYNMVMQEEKMTNICYYDICSDYPDALFDIDDYTCSCYSIDEKGDYKTEKIKYLGDW